MDYRRMIIRVFKDYEKENKEHKQEDKKKADTIMNKPEIINDFDTNMINSLFFRT